MTIIGLKLLKINFEGFRYCSSQSDVQAFSEESWVTSNRRPQSGAEESSNYEKVGSALIKLSSSGYIWVEAFYEIVMGVSTQDKSFLLDFFSRANAPPPTRFVKFSICWIPPPFRAASMCHTEEDKEISHGTLIKLTSRRKRDTEWTLSEFKADLGPKLVLLEYNTTETQWRADGNKRRYSLSLFGEIRYSICCCCSLLSPETHFKVFLLFFRWNLIETEMNLILGKGWGNKASASLERPILKRLGMICFWVI